MARHNLPIKEGFAKEPACEVEISKMFIVCNARRGVDLHAHLIDGAI